MSIEQAKLIILQAQMAAYPNKEHAATLGRFYELVEELENYRSLGDIDRLRELVEADKEGRLVVLPCKVGDTVWFLINQFNVSNETCEPTIVELVVTEMRGNKHNPLWYIAERENGERASFHPTEIGKTVFLTRAEAEAALQKEAQHE
jgi:hypothetical protein